VIIDDKLQLRDTFEAGGRIFRVPGYDELHKTDRAVLRAYIDLIMSSFNESGAAIAPGVREVTRHIIASGETGIKSEDSFPHVQVAAQRLVKLGFLAQREDINRHPNRWPTMLKIEPVAEYLLE
jgi:hypothetical protein